MRTLLLSAVLVLLALAGGANAVEVTLHHQKKEIRGGKWVRYVPCKGTGTTPLELVEGTHPEVAIVLCPGGQLTAVNASTGAVLWNHAGPSLDSDSGAIDRKKAYESVKPKVRHPSQDHCQWINNRQHGKYIIVCWTLFVPQYKGVLFALDAATGKSLWTSNIYSEPMYWKSLDVLSHDPKHQAKEHFMKQADHDVEVAEKLFRQKYPPTRSVHVATLAFFRSGTLVSFDVFTGKQLCVVKGRTNTVYDPPVEFLPSSGGRYGRVFVSNTSNPVIPGKIHRRPFRLMDLGSECKQL